MDLRSDTVTKPTDAMKKAMCEAEVGDDVFGDDPTVKALERKVANLLGKEEGLFVTSGTMGNLLAVGVHCNGRGQEVICGKDSHIFFYEQGGASSLMGVVFNTLENKADGTLDLEEVRRTIKPNDAHHAQAKVLALENTHNRKGGVVLSLDYMRQAKALCKELGLVLHVDGARLWNAIAALGVPADQVVAEADTVTVCLSKCLGAPVGSVLCGPVDVIRSARRLRKSLGGGMRQAGVLAAAGIHAIDHHMERITTEDHANAKRLSEGLAALGLEVTPPETNIVIFWVDNAPKFKAALDDKGIWILCVDGLRRCRAIPNLHISSADIDKMLSTVAEILESGAHGPPPKRSRT